MINSADEARALIEEGKTSMRIKTTALEFAHGYLAALEGPEVKAKDAEIADWKASYKAQFEKYSFRELELNTELQSERERSTALVERINKILDEADDIEYDTAEEFRKAIAVNRFMVDK